MLQKISFKLAISILFFLLLSCSRSEQISLKQKKVLKIPITGEIEYKTNNSQFLLDKNGSSYIVFDNRNTLIFFNMKQNRKEFQINIRGGIDAMHVISVDSIFIIPCGSREIIMMDSSGKQKMKWDLINLFDDNIRFESYKLIFYKKNRDEIYFFVDLTHSASAEDYYHYPKILIMRLDPKGKVVSAKKAVNYPDKFKKGRNYLSFYPDFSLNDNNRLTVLFEKEHSIYLYDFEGRLTNVEQFQSKYIKKFDIFDSDNVSQEYNVSYQTENPAYLKIIYNNFKNIYHIIALHRQKKISETGTVNNYFSRPWSIITLDNSMNIIDEQYMEEKKYRFTEIYPTPEGLLVSNNNEENKSFDENFLQYTLFEVVSK